MTKKLQFHTFVYTSLLCISLKLLNSTIDALLSTAGNFFIKKVHSNSNIILHCTHNERAKASNIIKAPVTTSTHQKLLKWRLFVIYLWFLQGPSHSKKKCEISHLGGGGIWTKLGHFHPFLIFFLLCPKSCKSAQKFFLVWGGGYPLIGKSKLFGHIKEKTCNFL